MKNKTAVLALLVLMFTASVSHARWGTEFTGTAWQMYGQGLERSEATGKTWASNNAGSRFEGFVERRKVGGSAGFFVEGNSRFRLGFGLGFGAMPEVYAELHKVFANSTFKYTSVRAKTMYIPADLYLKFTSKAGGFSMYGGGGADYIMVSNKYEVINTNTPQVDRATLTQNKIVPHAQAGFEFFLAKWLSINVGAKAMFGAVLDNMTGDLKRDGVSLGKKRMMMKDTTDGMELKLQSNLGANDLKYKYDYSGLRANVGLRIYFK